MGERKKGQMLPGLESLIVRPKGRVPLEMIQYHITAFIIELSLSSSDIYWTLSTKTV